MIVGCIENATLPLSSPSVSVCLFLTLSLHLFLSFSLYEHIIYVCMQLYIAGINIAYIPKVYLPFLHKSMYIKASFKKVGVNFKITSRGEQT